MKNKGIFIFLAISFGFCSVQANVTTKLSPKSFIPQTVYGDDDRQDVYACTNPLMKKLARSTAGQIPVGNLVQLGDLYTIKAPTMVEKGLCKSERFSNQLQATDCSGFLVGPDILVTAGHCVLDISECSSFRWIFDYANETEERSQFILNKDQVFHCTEILDRQLEGSGGKIDYAVVKLDRPVPGREPLKYRTSGMIDDNASLTVIGHPSGTPTKITPNAAMRKNVEPAYFVTNADTFGGNSGSAVINSETGLVEGILVRGDRDYYKSPDEDCDIVNKNDPDSGIGEEVTRITIVPYLTAPQ